MSTLSCMYVVLCKQKPSNWPNPLPRQISTYMIGKHQKEEPCGFADLQGPLNCMEGHGQQKVKHSLFTNFTPRTTEKMITKNRRLFRNEFIKEFLSLILILFMKLLKYLAHLKTAT
jgi:hypothetical protein